MVGGPQNLYNLLSQFSADSYCILTSYEAIRRGNASGTWLAGEYFFSDHAGPIEKLPVSQPSALRRTPFNWAYQWLGRLARKMPYPAAYFLRATLTALYLLLTIVRMVRIGIRIVRQRGIRRILGISDVGPALIATYLISRCTGVPYALYLFDIYLGNNLLPMNELLAKMFEPRMLKMASVVIVTNERTERFYRKRYGDTFKCAVVHNSVFPRGYESRRTPYNPSEPYTILFTGQVYWAQERSVMNLVRTMDELRDLRVQLDLYVPNASETLKLAIGARSNIRLTAATQSEMPAIQCSATLLFLPLSWHTKSLDVIATASPGKLADYLASGRPILIHAPPYTYVNQYAKENGFALVVDEENIEKLKDGIKKLLFDLEYSRQLIENAKRTFYKNHDATINAQKLAKILE